MATVELRDVSKIYPDGVQAVNHLSLSIGDREFIVLVGPSGCGKTTTLRMVAGLEEISSGTLSIDGRIVNDVAPKDRDIAMVFQNYALYPHMNVYRNMAFSLQMRRHDLKLTSAEIDRRVRETAAILGLTEVLNSKPKTLSGGQRQRVAVGRAIVRNPKAFLFDEPLSNLDAKLRLGTRAEIKRLHQRLRTTTIYVTHDQEEAMTLGDRIVVMKDGVIQQCAAPLEVYQHPANRFVAGFIGTPPMNMLLGSLAEGKYFSFGNQRLELPVRLTSAMKGAANGPIELGIRPELLSPNNTGDSTSPGAQIHGVVNVIEPLGNQVDIHFSADEHPHLVCRTDARHMGSIQVQTRVVFSVDMEKCHLFETTATGKNLTL
ncbi:MAG TPA: sn-glycerol-3-phosphate ABC transporter ATP-binding protein UgpC [Phycisphaerae bacterium]|nr:sn-glycerol-3-phosphate ABC transporter ATP-binding protein UgpC [Phycisphaerae bacterium]